MAVHIPGDLPDSRWDLIEQFCLLHKITELGAEDDRESLERHKEIGSGGMPGAIGGTNGAARNDVVDVGMILKSASPGVQHPEEARQIATNVLGICGEFLDSSGGSLEQSRVTGALVLAHERAQRFGECKGNQEVVPRELALDLFFKPLLSFVVLAGGAVAIAAGNKELLRLGAALALVKRDTASLGATGHDGVDDFAMDLRHGRGITLEILGAKGGEDFTDGGHDRVPPSRD